MKKFFFPLVIATVALFVAGCTEDGTEPQLPAAKISNPSQTTAIAQGEHLSLTAEITTDTPAAIEWLVDGEPVAGANTNVFDFVGEQTGEHVITLNVANQAGEASDEVTVTVYYEITFEDQSVQPYVAESESGGVVDGGYVDATSNLKMPAAVNHGGSWSGIAISQYNDVETAGYINQLSAYYKDPTSSLGGYGGSETFAVSFSGELAFDDATSEATFYHVWVTNSTYAALSMKDGDAYAQKFEQGDWFKLVITATDASGAETGKVEYYLADFRTDKSPGILTKWEKIDLTPLGDKVHKLTFTLSSSDNSEYEGVTYMNTPAYFCFDNLAFLK